MTNTNPNTGIRFGVIACHHLDGDVVDELFYGPGAVDLSYKAAYDEAKAQAEALYESLIDEADMSAAESGADREVGFDRERLQEMWFEFKNHEYDKEMFVERELERDTDIGWQCDEPEIEGVYEGVTYRIGWLGGAPLLWSFDGPLTYVRSLCSPCVPNAASLESGFDPHGMLCHAIPADWLPEDTTLRLFYGQQMKEVQP